MGLRIRHPGQVGPRFYIRLHVSLLDKGRPIVTLILDGLPSFWLQYDFACLSYREIFPSIVVCGGLLMSIIKGILVESKALWPVLTSLFAHGCKQHKQTLSASMPHESTFGIVAHSDREETLL